MREGKEKNGSAQPGAIHNLCSQAFNTVSKLLEVQTVEFTFQSTDNPWYFLTPWWHQQRMMPLPYPGGLGPGSSHPHFCSAREGCCPPPPAEACGGKNCPVGYSSQGSVQFWAIPGHKCTVMACSAQHMPSCGRSNGKF